MIINENVEKNGDLKLILVELQIIKLGRHYMYYLFLHFVSTL